MSRLIKRVIMILFELLRRYVNLIDPDYDMGTDAKIYFSIKKEIPEIT